MDELQNASDIVSQLNKLRSKAKKYKTLLEDLKKQFTEVKTEDDFLNTLNSIVDQGKLVHEAVFDSVKNADQKTIDMFFEKIKQDNHLAPIEQLLNFNNTFHHDIVTTKERLSKQKLKEQLSPEQFEVAESFIDSIKNLKPLSHLLISEIDQLRIQLNETTSISQVDELESKITELHQSMNQVYQRLVKFPENEETAGTVINFLESNQELFSIIKPFNVYGALEDDLLHSTARLHKDLNLSRMQL